MSFFYLMPVRGELPLHIIETIVDNRLEFLIKIFKNESIEYNEFIVEDSVYDNVGHFMVRLASRLYQNNEFCQFVYNAEIKLFKKRLEALSSYDLRCFAKKIIRITRKYKTIPIYIKALIEICQKLMLKVIAQHVVSSHCNECTMHSFTIHFKYCLPLVAERQVELSNGQAKIHCGIWINYLMMIFKMHLLSTGDNLHLDWLRNDPRLQDVFSNIITKKINLMKINISNKYLLFSNDVDKCSKYFPPCMLNLHSTLRRKHRLSHEQRFYYSLFLKDIGMPIDEAVRFWRAEYSQLPSGNNVCSHSWAKDEKKYLYGIRHMYGLEGGRKQYSSVSCTRIQSSTNACSEGGCPFKSFDDRNIIDLLEPYCTESHVFMSQIKEFKNKQLYNLACKYYLEQINQLNKSPARQNKITFHFTPVTFYEICSETRMCDF